MIKNIYAFIVYCCFICSLLGINGKQSTHSKYILKNIEALASEEKGVIYYCIGEGNEICPSTGKKVKGFYILNK